MDLGSTKPEELIKMILNSKAEPYPYARVVALLAFSVWMRWPLDPELVRIAQTIAAANVALAKKELIDISDMPLSIEILCDALINKSLAEPFANVFDESDDTIVRIIGFFMHCPEDQKPSLLKARYFIENGGFAPDEVSKDETKEFIVSSSTLKAVWKNQATSGPFMWAAYYYEDDSETPEQKLIELAPDDPDSVHEAEALLQDRGQLTRFLGVARFCQEKLLRLLDPAASSRFQAVKFPEEIKPVIPNIGTFDEGQLTILRNYAVPQ